ncbi:MULTISPECIES: endonuclease/exonuclease/phosphatase family protein [unclassified Planococcus (in: firmicutes)]|uniref:endonuclease/exonuclease/phosphatase family protein n=1 Tax=unclassified Planococcus (in: firmicutes) TaxID=2662419 RepID=UPI001F233B92|nr:MULTISPECIES: endonuclease/exonuclease/phosphatase family protein [unclassified Planococcus (in: firmicutes)]UJF27160.1 endonuclease/exonuclease/phosphatase family protein [Planococcus sp. 107-1]GKW46486.1 metal-dependent hydrolase [Planococcus sp. NCCP-2050]
MEENRTVSTIPLKVMSFNIAHGMGMDNKVDLERIAYIIEQSGTEVIGLQELDRYFDERSSFIDQVEWLSERLGMYAAFGANLNLEPIEAERPRRQYGNAVFSKYPIKYVENHLLTEVESPFTPSEQRGILEAVIEVKGTYLSFYNTHLSLKEEQLQLNVDEILAIMDKSHFPKVLTGDFNANPEQPQIKRLTNWLNDAFADVEEGKSFTYPAPHQDGSDGVMLKPITRIDYILTDSLLPPKQASVIETSASDHLPIVAELVLASAAKPTKSAAGMRNQ